MVAAGLLSGLAVAVLSVSSGAGPCGTDAGCHSLARTMAMRMGIVTGLATVIMVLLVAGLARMSRQDEARRAAIRDAGASGVPVADRK